jgi:hypothetical protein
VLDDLHRRRLSWKNKRSCLARLNRENHQIHEVNSHTLLVMVMSNFPLAASSATSIVQQPSQPGELTTSVYS